jgi:hypothetical protein
MPSSISVKVPDRKLHLDSNEFWLLNFEIHESVVGSNRIKSIMCYLGL